MAVDGLCLGPCLGAVALNPMSVMFVSDAIDVVVQGTLHFAMGRTNWSVSSSASGFSRHVCLGAAI